MFSLAPLLFRGIRFYLTNYILFVKMFGNFQQNNHFFLKEKIFLWRKKMKNLWEKFQKYLIFQHGIFKLLVNYSTNICWNCLCIIIYCVVLWNGHALARYVGEGVRQARSLRRALRCAQHKMGKRETIPWHNGLRWQIQQRIWSLLWVYYDHWKIMSYNVVKEMT